MMPKDALAYQQPDAVAPVAPTTATATTPTTPVSQFTKFDSLDLLAIEMLPPEVTRSPRAKLNGAEAISIFEEGARGATTRSLLAKDISASRMHLRYFGALLDHAVERLGRGRGDVKLARFYSDLVDKQHRRLIAGVEALQRLEAAPPARFEVKAHQAAFMLQGN